MAEPASAVSSRPSRSVSAMPGPHDLGDHAARDVDGVRHQLAVEGLAHRAGDGDAGLLLRLVGGRPEVRRRHHLVEAEQRGVGAGLLLEHVETGRADPAVGERRRERALVDDAAAGGVDDDDAAPHPAQRVLADQADRLGRARQVDGDDVGLLEELVEADQADAELRRARGGDVRVVGHDVHLEGLQPLRHQHADLAEPHHAEGLARELDAGEPRAVPASGAQRGVGRRDPPGGGEHQADGVLGGGGDVRGGGVDDHHPGSGGGGDVDVVEADAGPGHHPQGGRGGEHLGVDLRGGPHQQRGGAGHLAQERGAVGAVDGAHVDAAAERGHGGGRELLRDQDDGEVVGCGRAGPAALLRHAPSLGPRCGRRCSSTSRRRPSAAVRVR